MWKTSVLASATLALCLVSVCESAKILCLMTTISRSHHIFNRPLTLELAKRGHQVTVIAPDKEEKPVRNLREILIEGAYDDVHGDFQTYAEMTHVGMASELFKWGLSACEHTLNSRGARQLLELTKNETFDLIIAETVIQECMLGVVSKVGYPPVIGITAYASPPWANDMVGNIQNPAYVNTYTLPLTDHMTFTQKMHNFILDSYVWFYRKFFYMPQQDEMSRKFFGDSAALPSEVERNFSFVMVNTHFTTDNPKPLVPAIIEIGGLQAKPPQPLPQDLKEFLDSAKDGAIFMSLGSNIRSDTLDEASRRAFLEAFAALPQKVLWKWESDSLPGQPPNVKIIKWAPQNDILAMWRRLLQCLCPCVTRQGAGDTEDVEDVATPAVESRLQEWCYSLEIFQKKFLGNRELEVADHVVATITEVSAPSTLMTQIATPARSAELPQQRLRQCRRRRQGVHSGRGRRLIVQQIYRYKYLKPTRFQGK